LRRDLKVISNHYVDFIRSKPCCVCMRQPVDCDHLQARGTGNGKRNDLTGIPLCREHHSERGQVGNKQFEYKYGSLNLWQEAAFCLIEFFIHEGRRKEATIYVSDKKSYSDL